MTRFIKSAAIAAASAGLMAVAAPASAAEAFTPIQPASIENGVSSWQYSRDRNWRDRRGRDDYRDRYGYRDNRGDRVHANTRVWRGRDGRYYCRKDNGTTGLLIGGAVGGLLGNGIAGGGDRTLGTILGVAGGALLGRAIDRSDSRCR